MAAKFILHIPYIAWREGRPRFVLTPAMRRMRFSRSRDLRHPDGTWFTMEEARAFSERIQEEWRAFAAASGPARAAARRKALMPSCHHAVANLVSGVLARPEFRGRAQKNGRRTRRALKPATVRGYLEAERIVRQEAMEFWAMDARLIRPADARALLERIEERRGLAQARKVRALLSMCWNRAGAQFNPFTGIKMPAPAGRLRPATRKEVAALMAAARAMDRHDVAAVILTGALTGLRQADRLALRDSDWRDDMLQITQEKTGAPLRIPVIKPLADQLAASRARARAAGFVTGRLLNNEREKKPWNGDRYRRAYAIVRAAAARQCPSVSGLRDQDMRDTCATWLARAGATQPQIAAITGHKTGAAASVLYAHYLADHAETAAAAMHKLTAWLDGYDGIIT